MKDLCEEKNKFQEIRKEYQRKKAELLEEVKSVHFKFGNDEWSAKEMKESLQNKLFLMEKNEKAPYFARIDFTEDGYPLQACYLGKIGIQNEQNENVIIDWRAPIASLYYDYSTGRVSYLAQAGRISGDLSLKRQYEFEEGELLLYRDVAFASNDELLNPYLNKDAGSRLQNIVASIQEEQNAIIRKSFFQDMIIQGVAGSGKTTVALHRIAYLVYNYMDQFSSKQYLLIGPNSFFVNYISSVLPDLDVHDVIQKDFVTFAKQFCKESYKIVPGSTSESSYKVSLDCQKDIDVFLENWVAEKLKEASLTMYGFSIIDKGVFYKIWKTEVKYSPVLQVMIDKCHTQVIRYLRQNEPVLLNRAEAWFLEALETNTHPHLGKEYAHIQKQIEKGMRTETRKILSDLKQKPSILYKRFLKEKGLPPIQRNEFRIEDLGALLHLRYRLDGSGFYENYRCTMIDEAQDYGPFHFYALKEILSQSHFSILGDLAQSLYPSRSIASWSEVETIFGPQMKTSILEKSYRTTIEIMTEANKINHFLQLQEAIPVIRHGQEVQYQKVENYEKSILQKLPFLLSKHKTIALIHKEEKVVKKLYQSLSKSSFSITHIEEGSMEYNGGICLLTSSLSKGLEFDVVIILGAEDTIFCKENTLDMKLLYVSMTRALHELYILYQDTLCTVLQNN